LAEWLGQLVQIPSVTPDQAGPRAGIAGEARLADRVAEWFRAFGGEVEYDVVLPGRANIYGTWPGRSDRWAAVDVHLDTVGVEEMIGDPFSGHVHDGRVHGRGALDTKATLGVVLALLEAMHVSRSRPEPNLLIAATVDEEVGGRGAPAFARWVRRRGLSLDQLAVAEPTGCTPVVGHNGVLRMQFKVDGSPAHASQPHLGRNAVAAAAHLLLALEAEHQRLLEVVGAVSAARPSLCVTRIEGGSGTNVVPASCRFVVDRRLAPGETGAHEAAQLITFAENRCPLPVSATVLLDVPSFSQSPEGAWVRQLVAWTGERLKVVPFCTNAWAYGGLARECVVMGPGSIDHAHGRVEWVEIAELEKLESVYTRWWGLGR